MINDLDNNDKRKIADITSELVEHIHMHKPTLAINLGVCSCLFLNSVNTSLEEALAMLKLKDPKLIETFVNDFVLKLMGEIHKSLRDIMLLQGEAAKRQRNPVDIINELDVDLAFVSTKTKPTN